jgi:hydroxymethylcytosylglucuronate/cytosylglucuronate synthase
MFTAGDKRLLLAAICDFGWGSLGKCRLILDCLGPTDVALFGNVGVNRAATRLLASHHRFVDRPPGTAEVALVINDPAAANAIADLGVPVIYVDSLPYLWANESEIPASGKTAYYCAQKFPSDRVALSRALSGRTDIRWIDPIVPPPVYRRGGHGTVVNVGGLHSHLAGDTVEAYLRLVLVPLAEQLRAADRSVLAVCGNLSAGSVEMLRAILGEGTRIGPQSPYEFQRLLQDADLLVTSPGSTTILQAITIGVPTLLLPPQNLSQVLNSILYAAPAAPRLDWPSDVMSTERVEQLRPLGEDAVLSYMYGSIAAAAQSPTLLACVADAVRKAVLLAPPEGVLDPSLRSLGRNGASQVAQLIKQAMLAPIARPS